MRFVQRILAMLFYAAVGAAGFCAIGGAFIALFGGLFGFEDARSLGGKVSGIGVIAFFALLFSPLGEAVSYMDGGRRRKSGETSD